jgi:hypothetical protein
VPEFLIEVYVPRPVATRSTPRSEDVSAAAELLTNGGMRVRLVRSILVPEDETCFYLFEAETGEAVREVAARAGLQLERVVEAAPDWNKPSGAV